MSKRQQKRAARRTGEYPDGRRDYLMHSERKGKAQTTPVQFLHQALREPFYLPELGLQPVLRGPHAADLGEPGVIRRRRASSASEGSTLDHD